MPDIHKALSPIVGLQVKADLDLADVGSLSCRLLTTRTDQYFVVLLGPS